MNTHASDELNLLCRVHDYVCSLPLRHVIEIMRPLPVKALSGAPSFVSGLSVVRGEAVVVIDAARLISDVAEPPGRFVSMRSGERRLALAVAGVLDVVVLPRQTLSRLPALLGTDSPDSADAHAAIAAIGTLDTELLLLLSSAKLVPEALWRELDHAAAREAQS